MVLACENRNNASGQGVSLLIWPLNKWPTCRHISAHFRMWTYNTLSGKGVDLELLVPPRNQMKCKKRILCVTTVIRVTRLLLWPHSSKERSMRLTGLGGSRLQCPHLSTHRAFKDRAPTQPKKNSLPLCHCLCNWYHCCHCPCHCDYTIAIAISLSLNFIMPRPRSSSGSHDLIRQSVGFNSTTPLLLATQDWHLPKMWTDGNEDRGGRYKEANVQIICIETIFACNTG